jgi:exopolysaccharide biosynthesis protein
MTKLQALMVSILLPAFGYAFECEPKNGIGWNKLSDGVSWTKYDLAFTPYLKNQRSWSAEKSRSVTVRALKIDLTKNKLRFLSPEHNVSCNPATERYISNVIKDSGAPVVAAINASFFVMPAGKILGMALDEKTLWSDDIASQTMSSSGIFGILNGQYFLESKDNFLKQYGSVISREEAKKYTFAIQAYPRLVKDGEIQISDSVLNSRRSRTSIGVDQNSEELVLVTIDARGENAVTGMTLFEYAHFMKTPKCGVSQKISLNLDGGGSTAFAIPSQNISEQADRCRHLGNVLTIQVEGK